jgi:hypothetical protein
LECSFCGVPSSILYDTFVQKYNTQSDCEVARQIAILFTLLPVNQQPTSQLEYWCKNCPEQLVSSQESSAASNAIEVEQEVYPVDLLPRNYYIQKVQATSIDKSEFIVQPPFSLYGQTKNDDERERLTMTTAFGPMSSGSLIRDIPRYSWNTYSLLALAGAASCAVTHALVIPLDGTVFVDWTLS